jgi:transcriptional regulator with XRE-family HTH domain
MVRPTSTKRRRSKRPLLPISRREALRGERLAELYKEHGYTQASFAAALYVSPRTLRRWTRGEMELTMEVWRRVARALGADLGEVLVTVGYVKRQAMPTALAS